MKDFTKSDLKTGMLVQYRDKSIGMIINDYIAEKNTYSAQMYFNHDLTEISGNEKLDIIRVSSVLQGSDIMYRNWTEKTLLNNLLWESESKKTYEIDGVEYSESSLKSLIKKATS